MKELGEYLKQTRVSNGVTITEAADDLDLATSQLENIESGNVRAFKDVYSLKQYIRQYAKYLGLDPERVVDEFNGFLFEHTSKISLADIKEAQRKLEEEERQKEKKVKSPYTMEYREKIKIWPFIIIIVIVALVSLIVTFIIVHIDKTPVRTDELSFSIYRKEII